MKSFLYDGLPVVAPPPPYTWLITMSFEIAFATWGAGATLATIATTIMATNTSVTCLFIDFSYLKWVSSDEGLIH
jgi:hypothetical protein